MTEVVDSSNLTSRDGDDAGGFASTVETEDVTGGDSEGTHSGSFVGKAKWGGKLKGLTRSLNSSKPMSRRERLKNHFASLRNARSSMARQVTIRTDRTRNRGFRLIPESFMSRFMKGQSTLSFSRLLLNACMVYFIAVTMFTLFLQGFNLYHHKLLDEMCVSGYQYGAALDKSNFSVMFELSWTTISTVGYGAVAIVEEESCRLIRVVLSIEAFLGIMYAGYCGAVLFSKLSILLAHAQVTFAGPICLRFGSGVPSFVADEDDADPMEEQQEDHSDKIPFPIIEMRVFNDLARFGGEIVNAKMVCTVVKIVDCDENDDEPQDSSECMPRERAFIDLKVSPDTYPFFGQVVWHFFHVLNAESPLLKDSVLDRIASENSWPTDLDRHDKIRECLADEIEEITMSIEGKSNLTADYVYKTQVYKIDDICIGWKFAPISVLAKTGNRRGLESSSFQDDVSLLDDVIRQDGDGEDSSIAQPLSGQQQSFPRTPELSKPMGVWARSWSKLSLMMRCLYSCRPSRGSLHQYRISSRRKVAAGFGRFESMIVSYSLWHHRTSFARSILVSLVLYMLLILIFSVIIAGIVDLIEATRTIECVPDWFEAKAVWGRFYLAYELSWTTISSVGYGVISPSVGEECGGLTFVLSIEAFLGLLYTGFSGAIFYAKLSRSQRNAAVTFARPICLQYGAGLSEKRLQLLSRTHVPTCGRSQSRFPIMEMRVVNDMSNRRRVRVGDATLTCVVTSIRVAQETSRVKSTSGVFRFDFVEEFHQAAETEASNLSEIVRTVEKLEVTPDSRQPYFGEGAWSFAHVLNGQSPLLRPRVRKRIEESGSWPSDIDNPEKIRAALSPNVKDMVVMFEGTSNMTADYVFRIHVFRPEDLCIGWRFAGLAYKENDDGGRDQGSNDVEEDIKYDLSLIDDVVPQRGGGNELLEPSL